MGNITSCTKNDTTHTFTWGEGRMLLGVSVDASNNATYTYDASGLRRQKVVTANGQAVTTDFIWGNNGLAGFKRGNTTVTILYDVEGQPVGFIVNDAVYTYVKNIQGDVMKVLDSAGNTVVSYSYDPWGVPTITGNTALAAYNPCSYRGYYYDFETGFYYLQSRYYDPELGRFISPDNGELVLASASILGHNLFVYCTNNPVNYVDREGYLTLPWQIKVGLAAGVASAIWEAVKFISNNPNLSVLSWQFLKGLGTSVARGFVRGFLLGVLTCVSKSWQYGAIGGTISLIYQISIDSINGKSSSLNQCISAFMNGWSAAVYAKTFSNVVRNVSAICKWSPKKADYIDFIVDTLLGLGISSVLKW